MNAWPKVSPLAAGLALIAVTNGVALLGVAWNRSGTPDSQLQLSQRELHSPYGWRVRDNNGIALKLAWRVPMPPGKESDGEYASSGGGMPRWLDAAKMRSLGFELAAGGADDGRQTQRERTREVLLVLELGGPDTRHSLEAAQRKAAEADALLAANPDMKEFQQRARWAHEQVKEEGEVRSRLFAVDAGLVQETLRAKYPDRNRFLIAPARVGVVNYGARRDGGQGYILGVINDTINVPQAMRRHFEREDEPVTRGRPTSTAPFQATVAFGQRLEPWLVAVAPATP